MNTIKNYVFLRFKTLTLITGCISFCLILLMLRIKFTHSFGFLFLVWNLFLAIIPYALTIYISTKHKMGKFWLTTYLVAWLLFLPNAPYIVTDLIHLKYSTTQLIWLDILIVGTFAFTGLLLFYLSIKDTLHILAHHFKKSTLTLLTACILFLSAFGVYLGRFSRYNSWEILSNPKFLLEDIFTIATKPIMHSEAWLFTGCFGLFLYLGFWAFEQLANDKTFNY